MEEVADIAVQLMQQVTAGQQPAQQQTAPAQPAPVQPATSAPDPDLAYSDTAAWQQQLQAANAQQTQQMMQQYAQPMMAQLGALAQQASENSPDNNIRTAWQKYKPEIVQLVTSQVVPDQRSKEAWDMAAKVVLSEHLDEVAAERAAVLAASTGAATEGGQQVGVDDSPTSGDALDEFWTSGHRQVQRLKNKGLNKASLREAARGMNIDIDTYVSMQKNENVIHEGNRTYRQVVDG